MILHMDPFLSLFFQVCFLLVCCTVLSFLFQKAHWKEIGNAMTRSSQQKLGFCTMVILNPLLEELLFRGLPWIFVRLEPLLFLPVGVLSTLAFAYMHSLYIVSLPAYPEHGLAARQRLRFNTRNVPLYQGIFGAWLWIVMGNYGIGWAIAAHMQINGLAFFLLLAIDSIQRKHARVRVW